MVAAVAVAAATPQDMTHDQQHWLQPAAL